MTFDDFLVKEWDFENEELVHYFNCFLLIDEFHEFTKQHLTNSLSKAACMYHGETTTLCDIKLVIDDEAANMRCEYELMSCCQIQRAITTRYIRSFEKVVTGIVAGFSAISLLNDKEILKNLFQELLKYTNKPTHKLIQVFVESLRAQIESLEQSFKNMH